MPSEGGMYRIKNDKRELVHRTKPAPIQPVKADEKKTNAAPAKSDTAAPKPAKSAAMQEGSSNGSE
ncbi:hypothetical protein [Vreelandella populi]|uniref:Uncharacterized protein n=1 Tax=Vreelandella populi TaxID=2498858 RepID=A0A3S0YHM0_9GAMM|nr:hypothetical protein [Halomonas populi]RUR43368.1 hypothetical protein ELY37_16760 [Halomonas populi]